MTRIAGSYAWCAEYDYESYGDLYSNALSDNEAIAAAVEFVQTQGCKVHVRKEGEYLAEVRPGYQKAIIIEDHRNGMVTEYQVPCLTNLVEMWLDCVHEA